MIDQLITALSKEVGLSAEEIADTIWLAFQMGQSESAFSDFPLIQEDKRGISNQETSRKPQPETSDSQETTTNQPTEEQKAGIYARNQHQTSTGSDLSFKVPDAPSLREPLTLARALKPLMRRFPSGTTLVLDEAATIQRIADEGLWLPVLKPTLEPWLDLELVVDESISMQIWRHTIRDLERLLKNYGIFRDVRVWGLIADEQEQVQIRRGIGATAKNKPLRSPSELIDPNGRRLVLVVSDCVSSFWRDGKVMSALEIWSKRGSMAIVQMLPKWLWKRTALGRASEVRLQGLNPGAFNQKLIAKEVSLWDELEEGTGIKVPVFTLEPDKVATWAQMLAGKGSIWTLGYVFKLDVTPVNKESRLFNLDYTQMSAEQRVQAFRVTASPMARKLAGLLAAAPVITLPIVRLIRETLLKDAQQVHVAEVFLGGLLKPLFEISAETNPDYVQYEFMDDVRELLVDSVPSEYVLSVVDEVSKYVAKKAGLSLDAFAAVLKKEKQVEDGNIAENIGYFATVTAQILRRLGGEYAEFADSIDNDIAVNHVTTEFEDTRYFSQQKRIRPYLLSRKDLKAQLEDFISEKDEIIESSNNNETLEIATSVTNNEQLVNQMNPQNSPIKNRNDNTIRILGDRGVGKTTFMAALASLSFIDSAIPFQISPIDEVSKRLLDDTQNILMQGLSLYPTNPTQLEELPFYSFNISLKPSLFVQPLSALTNKNVEMNISFREYPGELFNDLRSNRSDRYKYSDYIDDCATVSKLLFLVDGTTRDDREYAESVINLLEEIAKRLNNREILAQYRIAIVISKCEEPLLWINRHNVPRLMSLKFPRIQSALKRWSQSWGCKIAYFVCSSFGVIGNPPRPNFRLIRTDERGIIGILDNPRQWKPFGLLAPIYWLHTGKNDPRLKK